MGRCLLGGPVERCRQLMAIFARSLRRIYRHLRILDFEFVVDFRYAFDLLRQLDRGTSLLRARDRALQVRDAVLEPDADAVVTQLTALLQVLADHAGKVLERDEIYRRVWGYAMIHGDRSVDVFVRKLRSKLQRRSPGWDYIHTHFGIGYRFDPQPIVAAVGEAAIEPARDQPVPHETVEGIEVDTRGTAGL